MVPPPYGHISTNSCRNSTVEHCSGIYTPFPSPSHPAIVKISPAQPFLSISKSSPMAGGAAEGNRHRSGRSCGAGVSSAPPESRHPSSTAIDASSIDIGRLRALLESPGFSDRVDFVHLSDEHVRHLFVTPRIMRLAGAEQQPSKLLMPPPSRRRTLAQIRTWFKMGNIQRRQIMDEEADTTIIPSLWDDTIYWDGAWRTRPPLIPSTHAGETVDPPPPRRRCRGWWAPLMARQTTEGRRWWPRGWTAPAPARIVWTCLDGF